MKLYWADGSSRAVDLLTSLTLDGSEISKIEALKPKTALVVGWITFLNPITRSS